MKPSPIRKSLFLALIVAAMCPACDDTTESPARFEAAEPFDVTIARDARTSLSLVGVNGTIRITGSPTANSIEVTGTRRVVSNSFDDAEAHLDLLEVRIDTSGTRVVVETHQPAVADGRDYIVDYAIALPDAFALIVTNANGDVTLEALRNDIVVRCANGRVIASDIEADMDVKIGNGTVDASIVLPPGGIVVMDVANGGIDLNIPTVTSAAFSAKIANGAITLVGLTLSDEIRTLTSVQGTLGGGDGTITLTVANGSIVVTGN